MHRTAHGNLRMREVWPVLCVAFGVACGPSVSRAAAPQNCSAAIGSLPQLQSATARLVGRQPVVWTLAAPSGQERLVEVALAGNDALVEIVAGDKRVIGRSDHPERRSGTRWVIVGARAGESLSVRVTGKEHDATRGTASLRILAFDAFAADAPCRAVVRLIAGADSDYAAGQDVSHGRHGGGVSARHHFLRAAEGYGAAHRLLAALADPGLGGSAALAAAGVEYFDLQNWAAAASWASRASSELAPVDQYRTARSDALIAAAWMELAAGAAPGKPVADTGLDAEALRERARIALARLARLHLARHEPYDAALQVNNLGLIDLHEGRYSACAATFRRAEGLFAAIGEQPRQGIAAQNLGLCQWGLGELRAALGSMTIALGHLHPDPYPRLYLATLNNTALLHAALGELDAALRLHDQALALARQIEAPRDVAQSLFGIGTTYYALGDLGRARAALEQSLAIRSAALDGRGRMATLRALATIDADEGRPAVAQALDKEALALATAPAAQASIRLQLAEHLAAAGDRSAALGLLDAEIAADAGGDPLVVGRALLARAAVRRSNGDLTGALADVDAGRPRLRAHGSVSDSFLTEFEAARILRDRNMPDAALQAIGAALEYAGAMRLQTANPELRTQIQAPLRAAYAFEVDLLWDLHVAASGAGNGPRATALAGAAFTSADASRAHSLADVAAAQYPAALRTALAPQFARRAMLYREIAERRAALEAHEDATGSSDEQALALRADVARLESTLDTVNSAIAARAGRTERSGPADRPELRALLPRDTALIAYWLGPERAYVWVVDRSGIRWQRLGDPALISASARALHDALTRTIDLPASRRITASADVYDRVVRPIGPALAGYRNWLVVADAALDYVPFAALRGRDAAGEFFVVDRHDVALVPAAWMLRAERPRARGTPQLLLVADPVYERSDPRVAGDPAEGTSAEPAASRQLHRLAYAQREADAVAAAFAGSAIERLEGAGAAREPLLALDWSRYRYIHVATHAMVDVTHPAFSSLLVSRFDARGRPLEGVIRVADLTLLSFDADVVVYSGCETAFGNDVPGEGLLGLGYTTLARGSRAVVASLWPVADEMGARLMTEFYRHLLGARQPPMSALAAAMRDVLAREPAADPALWAPFQVSVVTVPAVAKPKPVASADRSTRPTEQM
jgi:CHAT domain-containing protein